MINQVKLKESVEKYKEAFEERWPDEKYKWEAIQCFQDHWDVNAVDFQEMFTAATEKTANLLASMNNFPRGMMQVYAKQEPEAVREMFIDLFDETKSVVDRILRFQSRAQDICDRVTPGKQHYQRPMAITVYLWLKYPSKYDIFKYSVCKSTSQYLENTFMPKRGDVSVNIKGNMELIDEILTEVKQDEELLNMYQEKLDDMCFSDESYRTLAFDISFYIANYLNDVKKKNENWIATEYNSGISKEQWVNLLNDEEVFTEEALEIVTRMKDYGGVASCLQLSTKYGETVGFYNMGSTMLAKRIYNKTNCELRIEDGKEEYWSILYTGRLADKEEEGAFIWKLRKELSEALDEVDLSEVALYANETKLDYEKQLEPYTKEDFLSEVFMTDEDYDTLKNVLLKKQNIILQGAPGVGKTFAAKRLAYSVMGCKDEERIEFVQFHQNYSYEDFIMGYKPNGDGFELRNGIFYKFCMKASENPEKKYFFIIDEINRGNMSKIFGELLMLIEKDYRGTKAVLAYNGQPFSVPKNLYIIGMMNTADRSLAMIDYALRRRFSFFTMRPGFESDGFREYLATLNDDTLYALIDVVIALNKAISEDSSLGAGFCIGHSYFCGQKVSDEEDLVGWMSSVVDYDVVPMLEEYWFDEPDKIRLWKNRLNGVFNN